LSERDLTEKLSKSFGSKHTCNIHPVFHLTPPTVRLSVAKVTDLDSSAMCSIYIGIFSQGPEPFLNTCTHFTHTFDKPLSRGRFLF